jgi:hypothetical protein
MQIVEGIMQTLFGFAFLARVDEFIPIIAIIMVFSIPIAAIVTEYFQKKNKARIIEKAIEKELPIDNLALDEPQKARLPYRSGMVMVATGLGVAIFGFAMGWAMGSVGEEDAVIMKAVFGAGGAIVLLIGVALLVNDKMNYARFQNGNGK